MTKKTKILVAFLSLCLSGMAYAGSCGSDSCDKETGSGDKSESTQP